MSSLKTPTTIDASTRRLVDVYVEGRLLATCPVTAPSSACADEIDREMLIEMARRMLADDQVLTDQECAGALFNVRRSSG